MAKTEWIPVRDFPNYEIHENEGIRHAKTQKGLKGRNWFGYPKVTLMRDGKKNERRIHKLVGEHFVDNPNNHPIVNHIDSDRSNHKKSNLEWTDNSGNQLHRWKTQKEGMKKMKYDREYGLNKISISLGQRISADPGLSSRILKRLSSHGKGFHSSGGADASQRVLDMVGENADGRGVRTMRQLLSDSQDALVDTPLSDPLKRASYFGEKGKVGRMLFHSKSSPIVNKGKIEAFDGGHSLDYDKLALENTISRRAEMTKAHNGILDGEAQKGYAPGTFKSYSKQRIPFHHATPKGNGENIRNAISRGDVSNNSGLGQAIYHSYLEPKGGLWAYPSKKDLLGGRRNTGVAGDIPANKVSFSTDTSEMGQDMSEMFIENKNLKFAGLKGRDSGISNPTKKSNS